MSSKVMVIISTAEKAKALTGIMYAVNAQKNKWKGSNVVPNTNRRHHTGGRRINSIRAAQAADKAEGQIFG